MNRKMFPLVVTLVLVFGLALVPAAKASAPFNQPATDEVQQTQPAGGAVVPSNPGIMEITANQPIEIPGKVLAPGTYKFELINANNEVAVSKADGSPAGMFFVIPTYRAAVSDNAVSVAEGAGGLDRIAAWYFPGSHDGYAFVYPKSTKLAEVARSATGR